MPAQEPVHPLFAADGAFFAVAEAAGRIVGLAVATQARAAEATRAPMAGRCHINLVLVDPARRGVGIGAALLKQLLRDAERLGHRRAQLWVRVDNDPARRLYEKLGFRSEGPIVHDPAKGAIAFYVRDLVSPGH